MHRDGVTWRGLRPDGAAGEDEKDKAARPPRAPGRSSPDSLHRAESSIAPRRFRIGAQRLYRPWVFGYQAGPTTCPGHGVASIGIETRPGALRAKCRQREAILEEAIL
jgi:hypothetical protein